MLSREDQQLMTHSEEDYQALDAVCEDMKRRYALLYDQVHDQVDAVAQLVSLMQTREVRILCTLAQERGFGPLAQFLRNELDTRVYGTNPNPAKPK